MGPDLRIEKADLTRPDVQLLLQDHLDDMFATSPPESVHALSPDELAQPDVSFYAARGYDGNLLGCGALKHLAEDAGELKTMRTVPAARGLGVGEVILTHLLEEARRRGYRTVHLETGSEDFFAPARRLYDRAGFRETPPFGSYSVDPHSVYMAMEL